MKARPAVAAAGFLRPKVMTVPCRAFPDGVAAGSAYVFARGRHPIRELRSLCHRRVRHGPEPGDHGGDAWAGGTTCWPRSLPPT